MSKGRKTYEVERIREIANNYLAYESEFHNDNADFRKGVMTLLESILHESGNYSGFGFLNESELEFSKPGIRKGECYEEWFADTDDSRRHYF